MKIISLGNDRLLGRADSWIGGLVEWDKCCELRIVSVRRGTLKRKDEVILKSIPGGRDVREGFLRKGKDGKELKGKGGEETPGGGDWPH